MPSATRIVLNGNALLKIFLLCRFHRDPGKLQGKSRASPIRIIKTWVRRDHLHARLKDGQDESSPRMVQVHTSFLSARENTERREPSTPKAPSSGGV